MASTSSNNNISSSAISAGTSVRIPSFSLDEFNNFVSSVLDKDLSLSFHSALQNKFHRQSHSPSNSQLSSNSIPISSPPSSPGFFLKLKHSASSLVLRNHGHGAPAAGKQSIETPPSPLSPQPVTNPPPPPPPPVRLPRSRSISFLSFSHSSSPSTSTSTSSPTNTPVSDIKRSLSKLKHTPSLRSLRSINTIRSRSSKASLSLRTSLSFSNFQSQPISRRTISNPSPVLANSIVSSPDSNPVRDCSDFAFGLAFEYPRRAPIPPSASAPAPTFSESYPSPEEEGGEPSEMGEHASFNFEHPDFGLGLGLGLRADADTETFDRLVEGGGGGLRDSGLGFLDGVSISDFKQTRGDHRSNSKADFQSKGERREAGTGVDAATPTATSTPKRVTRAYRSKATPRLHNLTVPPFSGYTTTEYLHPDSASSPSSPLGLYSPSGSGSGSGSASSSGSNSPSTPTPIPTPTSGVPTASTSTARPSDLDYTPTTTPTQTQTPTSTYSTHPYAHAHPYAQASSHHRSHPSLSPSLSQHTSNSHSPLPTPLSTMFFPLPPPASPTLLEALSGMARAAVGVSARISMSFVGKDKGKDKEVIGGNNEMEWKRSSKPAPPSSLKKKESCASFKALISRLSTTSSVFKSSTASTSRLHLHQHQHPQPQSQPHTTDPLVSPVLHITAPPTSSVGSCVSLVYSSDGEDEDGVASPPAPLTPLEASFGQNASAVRIGVAGDQPEPDQSRTRSLLDDSGGYTIPEVVSKDKEKENRLLRIRSFSLSRSSTRSQPSLLGVLDSLDYPARGARNSGLSPSPSLSPLHTRRRRVSQVHAYSPPFHPLPTTPSSHHLSPTSTPSPSRSPSSSSSSPPSPTADWTLALPLLGERRGPLSLKRERAKDAEYKRLREEQRRRDDWTLGLDLAWSAGLLMGDKRGDVRVRGGGSGGSSRSRSRSLRQQKEGGENAKVVRSASRVIRPSSPFPLLDGNRSRKASLAVVDEDEDVDVRAGGGDSGSGEAERALHALLSDAGESLRVEDKTMTSSSREPWSSASSSVSSPEHSDSFSEGVEWSLRPISPNQQQQQQSYLHPVDADRASVISGPYYSARSSWQSALQTIKTGPSEALFSSHLDFSCIAATAAAPLSPS